MSARRYIFLLVYLIEFVMKVIARGFLLQPYSYLRDGWNWLDFIIIVISSAPLLFLFSFLSSSCTSKYRMF